MHKYQLRRVGLSGVLKASGALAVLCVIVILYGRSRQQPLQWYDAVHRSLDNSRLNVALVEEHHEALQYWFTAAHKKLIPSTGNVLIHIDAHPDSGTPADDVAFSKFKTPETGEQIQVLMQRNDVFIMAAAYKEFISTAIWIYPDWLKVSDVGARSMAGKEVKVKLGFYDSYSDGKLTSGFCSCYKAEEPEDTCDFTDDTGDLIQDFKGTCDTYREISTYLIKSSLAPTLLPELISRLANRPIILDVDEDYFGVMKGSDLLKDIDFKLIEAFNKLLAKTFTILNVRDESNAHTLLLNILHMIKVNCAKTIDDKRQCDQEHFRQIQQYIRESGLEDVSIGERTITADELQSLVTHTFEAFTAQNIDQLSQVGFCMPISPLTYKLKIAQEDQLSYNSIAVCHGINTPGSENQIMVPRPAELETTADTFNGILRLIPTKSVKLVTIARSNRDGFTPRHLQQRIEGHVLQSMKKKFVGCHVIHDPNLMLHLGQGIVT